MLVEFRVSNFASIKDEVVLSMVASSDTSKSENVRYDVDGFSTDLLLVGGIYGANASGKSNVCRAINQYKEMIHGPLKEYDATGQSFKPFKLDPEYPNKASVFDATVVFQGKDDKRLVRYQYGIAFDSQVIKGEWLYCYPMNRRRILFEREYQDNEKFPKIKFGTHWQGNDKRIVRATSHKNLFLSVASSFNHEFASELRMGFSKTLSSINTIGPFREAGFTLDRVSSSDAMRRMVLDALKAADTGITDLIVEEASVNDLGEKQRRLHGLVSNFLGIEEAPETYQIWRTQHSVKLHDSDYSGYFDSQEESDGTQKLFAYAGPLIDTFKSGSCLVIDEFDVQLHPVLAWMIISLFLDPKVNQNKAQLLFTTHNPIFLGHDGLLRRDQIWFTEKREDGSTDLFSLWDIKPRKDEDWQGRYLAGRYGAIPYLEPLINGDWDRE